MLCVLHLGLCNLMMAIETVSHTCFHRESTKFSIQLKSRWDKHSSMGLFTKICVHLSSWESHCDSLLESYQWGGSKERVWRKHYPKIILSAPFGQQSYYPKQKEWIYWVVLLHFERDYVNYKNSVLKFFHTITALSQWQCSTSSFTPQLGFDKYILH